MSLSSVYSLRRQYVQNGREEKDRSHSKQKVYTFNQNDSIQKPQLMDTYKCKSRTIEGSNHKNLHDMVYQNEIMQNHSIKYIRKQKNRQSSPSSHHRYLKEYQYNCYKLEESCPLYIEAKRKKTQNDGFPSDTKLGIKQNHVAYDEKPIQSQLEPFNLYAKLQNQSLGSYQSALKEKSLNNLRNTSQQLKQRLHSIPSKTLTFNELNSEAKLQPLCTRQEMALIKILRVQIDQLKSEILNKNVYIQALQNKLQNHLIERIKVQKTLQENMINLQDKIRQLRLQNQQIKKKVTSYQAQLGSWKALGQKLHFSYPSDTKSSQLVFQLNDTPVQQYFIPLFNSLSELNTQKRFIIKIHQMKSKIEGCHIENFSEKFNHLKPSQDETNLQSLWKWLKKVGKEYEIMKQRVSVFENSLSAQIN